MAAYRRAVLVNVAGSRGSLVGGVNEVLPTLPVVRGLGRDGFPVMAGGARPQALVVLDVAEPVGGSLLLVARLAASLRHRLLARAARPQGALQGRQGRGAARRRVGEERRQRLARFGGRVGVARDMLVGELQGRQLYRGARDAAARFRARVRAVVLQRASVRAR